MKRKVVDWTHGYAASSQYTHGFYNETTPAHLHWVALLQGYKMPLERFRYLDLGCGQGFNLIQMAALHPQAEFVGVDFMPEHVANAKRLAADASISNVTFIEADFTRLAKDPCQLGLFDYVVAHGITTWVSAAVRLALFSLAQSVARPGGLFYNSYNAYPGWLHVTPFQHLLLQYQKQLDSFSATKKSIAVLSKLIESNGPIHRALPGLKTQLSTISSKDPSYVPHEYSNHSWQPVFSSEMIMLAIEHKFKFMSSATLAEVFQGCYPADLNQIIQSERDPITRETIRDLALFQSFRRDVYVKGGVRYWSAEQLEVLRDVRLVATEMLPLPLSDQMFEWNVGNLKIYDERASNVRILGLFGSSGRSVGEVLSELGDLDLPQFLQKVSLLLQGGWLGLASESKDSLAIELNKAIAAAVSNGAPYQFLCLPAIQTAKPITQTDWLLMHMLSNEAETDLTAKAKLLITSMNRLKQAFSENGQAIKDDNLILKKAKETVATFYDKQLKRYQSLGAVN